MNDTPYRFTLITGASQGIGKSMAVECAKRKMNLFLVALPDSGTRVLAGELESRYGVRVEYFECDLTLSDTYKQVYQFSQDRGMTVDILINNAGVGHNGKLNLMDIALVDQMILLNLRAGTLLTCIYLNDLLKLDQAYILNMGSMAAWNPLPGKCVYSATKAYILFLSKALRAELRNTSVSVTSVYPYGVWTNENVRERIRLSGSLAKKTAMTPEAVAEIAIRSMLRKKNIIIPGKIGKMLLYAGFLVPQGLVLHLLEKEISKAPR